MGRYTESDLRRIFFLAVDSFNEVMNSDINIDNVHLVFFTPENGVSIYEEFCSKYFPAHLRENYTAEGYFESFAAQAFADDGIYGVMIRSDLDDDMGDLYEVFLHEISHIYCIRNEYHGKSFFDVNCMGSGAEDGFMNAGYAIWREVVADIMAHSVVTDFCTWGLSQVKSAVHELFQLISTNEPDSKRFIARIAVYIMLSKEVAGQKDWDKAELAIENKIHFDNTLVYVLLHQIFDNLHMPPYWSINPDFILLLGETYVSILTHETLKQIVQ